MTITLELPDKMMAMLLAEADEQNRSANQIAVERLVSSFHHNVDSYEVAEETTNLALERALREPLSETITLKQFRLEFDAYAASLEKERR